MAKKIPMAKNQALEFLAYTALLKAIADAGGMLRLTPADFAHAEDVQVKQPQWLISMDGNDFLIGLPKEEKAN